MSWSQKMELLQSDREGHLRKAAALTLLRNTELPARTIVEEALKAASEICIYTNTNFTIDELNTTHD